MRRILISAIRFYRNYLSTMHLQCCRFYPSCSEYAIEAVEKRGVLSGTLLSMWRVLRCNPFSKGGFDPVK